jgi:tetratricopeptide (TPR) repeat protein
MAKRKPHIPFVSVCMIARDEAQFIGRAIKSVKGLADEVWVGDTGSKDDTVRIARAAGAQVFRMEWPNDFAKARNAVLERARGRWIFVLDADEWFSDGDARRLRRDLLLWDRNPRVVGFSIYQANLLTLTEDTIQDKSRTVRGFRNRPQHRYVNPIHEQILPNLRGGIVETPYEIIHAGFVREVAVNKGKLERNLSMLEAMLAETPENNPHRVYLLLQRGREQLRGSRFELALADYEAAATLFLQQPPVRTGFAAILFAYLAEVQYKLGRDQAILEWAERLADRIPLTQAEWPFFQGLAHLRLRHWSQALAMFLETMACLEGAPYAQEYVSFDRTVLTHAGAVEALIELHRWPEAWRFLVRALEQYPDRRVLTETAVKLLGQVAPEEWSVLLQQVPVVARAGVARQALAVGNFRLALTAAEAAGREGSPDALVWAATVALHQFRPDLARTILAEVPTNHASQSLARRLLAMAAWQEGRPDEFGRLTEEDEPAYRMALRHWAGLPVDPELAGLAQYGLAALQYIVPLPPASVRSVESHAGAG